MSEISKKVDNVDKFSLWKGLESQMGADGRRKGEGHGVLKAERWGKIWKKNEGNLEKQAAIHGFEHRKRRI